MRSLNIAATGMLAQQLNVEVISNNIANMNTTAYKRQRAEFQDLLAIATTGAIELDFLERGLPVLATIANVAPMLGFLGTVIGMILAFEAIEIAGQVDPTLVAGGIKVALITTAAGLTIAVPVNVSYNYFVTRIDRLILDMEEGAQEVLSLIWSLEDTSGYQETA